MAIAEVDSQLYLSMPATLRHERGEDHEDEDMKTKTWTVIANTGKQAALESGLEKKEVPKPTHISAREFVHWLAPDSHIDDDSLRSLFRL
jgi:hypothetical protein